MAPPLSNRMKAARAYAGLNQEQLAERLGVERNTVARRESGAVGVTAESLIALANATGVPLEFLVDGFDGYAPRQSFNELVGRYVSGDLPDLAAPPDGPLAG